MKLRGKTVLITGASDGIGRSLALAFAESGAKVIALGRNGEALGRLGGEYREIVTRSCDITKVQQIVETFNWVQQDVGKLDVLVNNAGIWQKAGDIGEVTDEVIHDIVATNLLGTIYCTKYALPLLRQSGEPALVNIVSKSGVTAQAGQSAYTASKWGVKGFTDVLRADIKAEKLHIMAVYQSGTNTRMFAKAGEEVPLEKFTEPEDLAQLIVNCVGSPDKLWVPELHVNYA